MKLKPITFTLFLCAGVALGDDCCFPGVCCASEGDYTCQPVGSTCSGVKFDGWGKCGPGDNGVVCKPKQMNGESCEVNPSENDASVCQSGCCINGKCTNNCGQATGAILAFIGVAVCMIGGCYYFVHRRKKNKSTAFFQHQAQPGVAYLPPTVVQQQPSVAYAQQPQPGMYGQYGQQPQPGMYGQYGQQPQPGMYGQYGQQPQQYSQPITMPNQNIVQPQSVDGQQPNIGNNQHLGDSQQPQVFQPPQMPSQQPQVVQPPQMPPQQPQVVQPPQTPSQPKNIQTITVPPGYGEGQSKQILKLKFNGAEHKVKIPQGKGPGSTFQINLDLLPK